MFAYSNEGDFDPRSAVLHPGDNNWAFTSDSVKKEDFKSINTNDIIDSMRKLPLYNWKWKPDSIYVDSVNWVVRDFQYRHIGPMAQDFNHFFPYGVPYEDKISNGVINGILLVSVQKLINITDTLFDFRDEVFVKFNELEERINIIEEELDSSIIIQVDEKKNKIQVSNEKYETLRKENTELKLRLSILEEKINMMLELNGNIIDCYKDIQLDQNIPNPFDGMTEIKCFIPEKYGKNIKLIISDGTGQKEIKRYNIKSGIENILNVSAKDFDTGAYIYGIEIDGLVIKNKKMMIIK